MKRLLNLLVPVVTTLTLAVSGCAGQGIEDKGPILVGSKVDTEGATIPPITRSILPRLASSTLCNSSLVTLPQSTSNSHGSSYQNNNNYRLDCNWLVYFGRPSFRCPSFLTSCTHRILQHPSAIVHIIMNISHTKLYHSNNIAIYLD